MISDQFAGWVTLELNLEEEQRAFEDLHEELSGRWKVTGKPHGGAQGALARGWSDHLRTGVGTAREVLRVHFRGGRSRRA